MYAHSLYTCFSCISLSSESFDTKNCRAYFFTTTICFIRVTRPAIEEEREEVFEREGGDRQIKRHMVREREECVFLRAREKERDVCVGL